MLIILGIAIPYSAFIPFLIEHGLDVPLLIQQAGANGIAAFAWLDVVVSAVVVLVVAFSGKLITLKQAILVTILTCVAGVSAGLPLFFYFAVSAKNSGAAHSEQTSTAK